MLDRWKKVDADEKPELRREADQEERELRQTDVTDPQSSKAQDKPFAARQRPLSSGNLDTNIFRFLSKPSIASPSRLLHIH